MGAGVHNGGDIARALCQAQLFDPLQQEGGYFQILPEVVQAVDGHLQCQVL